MRRKAYRISARGWRQHPKIRGLWRRLCLLSKFIILFSLVACAIGMLLEDSYDKTDVFLTIIINIFIVTIGVVVIKMIRKLIQNIARKIKEATRVCRTQKLNGQDRSKETCEETCESKDNGNKISEIKIPQDSGYDEMLPAFVEAVLEMESCSVSVLQSKFFLGYARTAKIVEEMHELGIIGNYNGTSPRYVLVNEDDAIKKLQDIKSVHTLPEIDIDSIIKDEQEWVREQRGLSPVDNELYKIDFMEGHAFEYWCADRLKNAGFSNVRVTPGSNDMGVDILAEKDFIKYAIQCKCYSADLGNTPVQEVTAGKSFYNCHVGVVMTNRHFTKNAKDLALATGTLLWDRDFLKYLLMKENLSNE